MTTVLTREETCVVCGTTGVYPIIGSTVVLGPPDLDTRPSELMRSTLPYWMHRCPTCGYCAPNLSEGPAAVAAQVVGLERYGRQLEDEGYPELANRFLCHSMISEAANDPVGAGWAALRAAWACDDAGADGAATRCRERALEFFRRLYESGGRFANDIGTEEAIIADLLRRTGRFDEVAEICRLGLARSPNEVIGKVLRYQQTLAARADSQCHTVGEAMGEM